MSFINFLVYSSECAVVALVVSEQTVSVNELGIVVIVCPAYVKYLNGSIDWQHDKKKIVLSL